SLCRDVHDVRVGGMDPHARDLLGLGQAEERPVLPPSVVFHTPSPWETLPRIGNSPVPTYTMSGFDSETPMAPMVPPKYLSVIGSHVLPPSMLLKTPPPVVPNQYS